MTFFNYDVYGPLTKSLLEHSVTFWKDVSSSFWLREREREGERERETETEGDRDRERESWSKTVVKNVLKSWNIFISAPKSFSMKVVVAGTSCRIYAITDSLISQSSCNIMPVVQISFP